MEENLNKSNREIYQEYKDKVMFAKSDEEAKRLLNETDKAVVMFEGHGYAHHKYKVFRDAGISSRVLAIVCDNGYLHWGYRVEGSYIIVHTD